MLTSISVTASNSPYEGGVIITSSAQTSSLGGISTIEISRRKHNTTTWTVIASIPVSSVSNLSFSLFDSLALSGTNYDYYIKTKSGSSTLESNIIYNVYCYFDGLFIGDFDKHYIAGSNFKTETNRNMSVEYVTTLSGKYPYRVSNAELNYTTGTSAGLFLELSPDRKTFLPDTYHTFSNEVLDFLCDGKNKILKTHDGQGWYVSIDKEPNKVYSDFMGMNALQFSWTEIGDMPTRLDELDGD